MRNKSPQTKIWKSWARCSEEMLSYCFLFSFFFPFCGWLQLSCKSSLLWITVGFIKSALARWFFSWLTHGTWGYFLKRRTSQFTSCRQLFLPVCSLLWLLQELCPPAFPIQHSRCELVRLGSCQGLGSWGSSQCCVEVLRFWFLSSS